MKRKKSSFSGRLYRLDTVAVRAQPILRRSRPPENSDLVESKPAYISVLDLGTTYVKAAVGRLNGRRAEIVGQGIEPYRSRPHAGAGDARGGLVEACERALCQAEDMTEAYCTHKIVPDEVVIGLPAFSVRAGCHTVHYRRRSPQHPISESELSRALLSAQRAALAELKRTSGLPDALLISECTRALVEIDGHQSDDPIGLHGAIITVTMFNVLAAASAVAAIEQLADQLKFDPPYLMFAPQAVLLAWGERLGPEGVGFDVGGRYTTVSLWRKGFLRGVATIPVGGYDLTAALGRACQLDESGAERLKIAYAGGQFDPAQQEWIENVLRPSLERWTEGISKALHLLSQHEPIPANLWLWGGSSQLPDMYRAMQVVTHCETLAFAGYPTLRPLTAVHNPLLQDRTGLSEDAAWVNAQALVAAFALRDDASPMEAYVKRAITAAGESEHIPVWDAAER